MKFTYAAFLLLLIGCNGSEKVAELKMPGVYKMTSLSIKTDKTDSTYTNTEQLKIYTEDFMMYANINSPDSVSGYGIGSYSVNKDTVTENVIYNANDTSFNDKPQTYKLAVKKTDKGYQQLITGMQNNAGNKMDMTESYESTGLAVTTALDGAWKQVNRYQIKGKDTTFDKGSTEFKTYHAGYCMWGSNWKDSASKMHTGIGYGTFTMTGNKIKEMMKVSTFAQVRGHDFDIDIELMGKDGFKQSTTHKDGSVSVEIFERLKK